MTWLLPAILATLFNSILLTITYFYLYLLERQNFLRTWALSWVVYSLRFGFELWGESGGSELASLIGSQAASFLSGILLLYGSLQFIGRKTRPVFWAIATSLGLVWISFANLQALPFWLANAPVFFSLAAIYILIGLIFLRQVHPATAGERLTGTAFIVWGLHKADFPFLRNLPALAPWGFWLGSFLAMVVAVGVLISYTQKSRARLSQSEQSFRLLTENARDIIFRIRFSPQPVFEYISPAISRVSGYTPQEHYKNPDLASRIVHPEDQHLLDAFRPDGDFSKLEMRWIRKDGQMIWVEQINTPLYGQDGRVVGAQGIVREITERRRSEQALRASIEALNKLQEIINHSPSVALRWRSEPGWPIDYVSENIRLFGYQAEELKKTGASYADLIAPEDLPRLMEEVSHLRAEGRREYTQEYRMLTNDHQQRWVRDQTWAELDEDGQINYYQGVITDIHDWKLASESFRASEQRYRTLAESFPLGAVVTLDRELRFSFTAGSDFQAFENQPGSLIGKTLQESLPSESVQTMLPHVEAVFQGETRFFETDFREDYYYQLAAMPLPEPDGQIHEILVIAHNITGLRKAELALQKYAKRLELLHEIDRAILSAGQLDDFQAAILGKLAGLLEAESAQLLSITPPEPIARVLASSETFPAETEAIPPIDLTRLAGLERLVQGESLNLNLAGPSHGLLSPLIAQGELIGGLLLAGAGLDSLAHEQLEMLKEVSDQVAIAIQQARLNERIRQYNEELERMVAARTTELSERVDEVERLNTAMINLLEDLQESNLQSHRTADQLSILNAELESFAYSVSHDLRAPLRAINGFSGILKDRHRLNLNEEGQRYLENIITASEHMSQLIEDLLVYSRLGRKSVVLGRIAIRPILEEVLTNLSARIDELQANISLPDQIPPVLGDRTLLNQVFTNLLENALIYHRPGVPPEISIQTETGQRLMLIKVCDNGIGIREEFWDKIFRVFQRLHNQETYPGTGIGLALVKKAVDLMNGKVWVQSVAGQGSQFWIELPVPENGLGRENAS